jgi:DNA processing protein
LEDAAAQGGAELLPPAALWVAGRPPVGAVVARAVAVVGAADATRYGIEVAAGLASGLAGEGWTVVSGGGFGIAGAAHRAALAAGGATVAVLPGGLGRLYPLGHTILFGRIAAEGGLLLSEWPPECPPRREAVVARNRLIAALAAGTVVVEAGRVPRAGSAARRAGELGRALMAVPGPVTSTRWAGCHRLVQDGHARLVTGVHDVLEILDQHAAPAHPRHPPAGPGHPPAGPLAGPPQR